MDDQITPSLLAASAFQQLFEICSELARDAPAERQQTLAPRLRRLQGIRAEILEWVDLSRQGCP